MIVSEKALADDAANTFICSLEYTNTHIHPRTHTYLYSHMCKLVSIQPKLSAKGKKTTLM